MAEPMNCKPWGKWLIGIAIGTVLILGWPTAYRYERLSNDRTARINRITGDTWILDRSRWIHAGNPATLPN